MIFDGRSTSGQRACPAGKLEAHGGDRSWAGGHRVGRGIAFDHGNYAKMAFRCICLR
jgi:hypothetical protein